MSPVVVRSGGGGSETVDPHSVALAVNPLLLHLVVNPFPISGYYATQFIHNCFKLRTVPGIPFSPALCLKSDGFSALSEV